MMRAKTTCLVLSNLAPVMQVFPEGVYYGGVMDDLAHTPSDTRQHLRPAKAETS